VNVEQTLTAVKAEVEGFQTKAEHITNDFLEVYDILLHLKHIVSDDDFNKCFDKASELFYVVTGFKMQLEECITDLAKKILVVQFETMFNSVKANFVTKQKGFKDVLLDLKAGKS